MIFIFVILKYFMPFVAAVSKIDLPYKVAQDDVKSFARNFFAPSFPAIEKMLSAFDNAEIKTRNLCNPLDYFITLSGFEMSNKEFVSCALQYAVQAIEECIIAAAIDKNDITDIIFVSSTGLATPGLDALIANKMRLNKNINRMSIFGLGCAGGVSGFAKANAFAKANPNAIVLIVTVELCSLTFLKTDFSKSNFIGSSLFSDGIAASIIKGDNHLIKENKIEIIGSQSKLYYDSLDVMGWDFLDSGFKVIFSQDIPTIINKNVREDVLDFLKKHNLDLSDIKNFIFHPGGKKVLMAYADALAVEGDFLKYTRQVISEYGNMSSVTVLYVLEKFLSRGFQNGYGLMMALGPGFSSEMVLLNMTKK